MIDNALSIANENFTDAKWAQLAFILIGSTFVQSLDANKSTDDGVCIYNNNNNFKKCFVKPTSLRYPRKYDFVKQYQYYAGPNKLTGMKIFSVELLEDISFEYVLQVLLRRIVEKRSTKSKEDRFLIALYRKDVSLWHIAVVNKAIRYPKLSNGQNMLNMPQEYMVVKFFDPRYLFNDMGSNSEVHYIKL